MKHPMKVIQLSIALLLATPLAFAQSRSIFVPRSVTVDPTFELALNNYQNLYQHDECESFFSLKFMPFYQSTTKACDFAKYFTPNCQSRFVMAEDGSGDVNPIWFSGISQPGTLYTSTISFRPERQTYGAVINFYGNFGEQVPGLWMGINFAAMGARHNMNVCESGLDLDNVGTLTGLQVACELFNRPARQFSRISCCARSKGGVDNIQLKLGYDIYNCDARESKVGLYAAGIIPTGAKPKAKYLFEPLVGSRNGALGFGVYGDHRWSWEDCNGTNHAAAFMLDFKYLYNFKARQLRTFDLNGTGTATRVYNCCSTSCNNNGCSTGCDTSCNTGCSVSCDRGCSVDCNTSCNTGCSVSCDTGCSVGCSTGCSVDCGSSCNTSCNSSCGNDLGVRDWSRYLLLVSSTAPFVPSPFPAVNFVTQCADVTPRSLIEFWTAVHYEACKWEFELGYNLWWRQSEQVKCVGRIPAGYGIFDMGGVGGPTPTTSSTAQIWQTLLPAAAVPADALVSDPTFVELTNADLNITSGSQPSNLSNKIYGSIGRQHEHILYGINGSYEFGGRNHTPSQWAVWLTLSSQW